MEGGELEGAMQVGGAGLETCTVQGCSRADGTVQQLTLVSIKNAPSLQQLVAATLPAGTQPSQLRSLSISSSCMALPAVSSCPFLGHLTRLSLCLCSFAYAGALVGPEPLRRQAPRLHSLAVVGCSSEATVPPALVHLTGLRRLSLRGSLRELPPGCYLSDLESLDLGGNYFERLPPALAAATGLTELSLTYNDRLVLSTADVDGILRRLPHLRRLHLDMSNTPPQVLARLSECAPQLQISDTRLSLAWERQE